MSKRNSREEKARRRAQRSAAREHIQAGEDTSACRYPGCTRRWVMDIERIDGYSAFLCEPHGMVMVDELEAAGLVKRVVMTD